MDARYNLSGMTMGRGDGQYTLSGMTCPFGHPRKWLAGIHPKKIKDRCRIFVIQRQLKDLAEPWPRQPGHRSFAASAQDDILYRHPRKSSAGIHAKKDKDGCPITPVGHDERRWMPDTNCRA
jgi:hypothetical protein